MKLLNPLVFVFATTLVISACKKEGCRDTVASNYDGSAEKSDGSCVFQSNVTFWADEDANSGLTSNGSTTLYFYLDNALLGSASAATYYDTVPDCDATLDTRFTIDLGTSKARISEYTIRDEEDSVFWSGTINLFAGQCKTFQLSL